MWMKWKTASSVTSQELEQAKAASVKCASVRVSVPRSRSRTGADAGKSK